MDTVIIDRVLVDLRAASKRQMLQLLAQAAADLVGVEAGLVFEELVRRERLGSTGVGRGVAIPHARLAGLSRVHGIFARLREPVAFDAVDGAPVDLVYLLLAPPTGSNEHLTALGRIARRMRDAACCAGLRQADDAGTLVRLLGEDHAPAAA